MQGLLTHFTTIKNAESIIRDRALKEKFISEKGILVKGEYMTGHFAYMKFDIDDLDFLKKYMEIFANDKCLPSSDPSKPEPSPLFPSQIACIIFEPIISEWITEGMEKTKKNDFSKSLLSEKEKKKLGNFVISPKGATIQTNEHFKYIKYSELL